MLFFKSKEKKEEERNEKEWQKFNKKRRRLVWLYMKKAYVHWDKKQKLLHNLFYRRILKKVYTGYFDMLLF